MNDKHSLQILINKTNVNRSGDYFTLGSSYPPAKISKCVDKHYQNQCYNGWEPTLNEFMEVRKISGRDFALKIFNFSKHNAK